MRFALFVVLLGLSRFAFADAAIPDRAGEVGEIDLGETWEHDEGTVTVRTIVLPENRRWLRFKVRVRDACPSVKVAVEYRQKTGRAEILLDDPGETDEVCEAGCAVRARRKHAPPAGGTVRFQIRERTGKRHEVELHVYSCYLRVAQPDIEVPAACSTYVTAIMVEQAQCRPISQGVESPFHSSPASIMSECTAATKGKPKPDALQLIKSCMTYRRASCANARDGVRCPGW